MLYEHILRIGDIHQVRTHLLLDDRIVGDIRHTILLLQVEGIPYLPVLAITILL